MENLRLDQIRAFLGTGAKTSREIQLRLERSQPSVSRLISRLGSEVIALGKGPATRYALTRDIRDLGCDFPVYRVDDDGNVHSLGHLYTLRAGQYWWLDDTDGGHLYNYLPWFIQDMRPEGFVGRAFALRQGQTLGLPERLNDWNDDHVLIALARRGEDIVGNLIIGDESLGRYLESTRNGQQAVTFEEREDVYPGLAKAAMEGDPAGSSAGGEQPKFAVMLQNGDCQHVLVKFSPATDTAEGKRWADLLVCEHLALETIREIGLQAPESRIMVSGERTFLEVLRFDRVGRYGRLPMISLTAVDHEFLGALADWATTAGSLEAKGMISKEDADRMRWLYAFGRLIGNTDMHSGNLSLIYKGNRKFILAPIYDMLPMMFRPIDGVVSYALPGPGKEIRKQWDSALDGALAFWQKVVEEERLSEGFRANCQAIYTKVQSVKSGPRLVV